ncbi:MAG: type II toxin-antitoxin system VapC family toxin, partial [Planctomycetes bacterium]|nr:type II toxin-antitoxin system VapC family toxin [Planctomycetota bacterium]
MNSSIWARILSASASATHVIAYAELRAALARLRREERLDEHELNELKSRLEADWAHLVRVEPRHSVLQRAGDLAEGFALRGHDSVHLAAADHMRTESRIPMVFACFDRRLNQAAEI